jgi:DNA-directed RNA polymerase specialized sigma subunit
VPPDETQDLWRAYTKTKDQAVRDRMILSYAPLV